MDTSHQHQNYDPDRDILIIQRPLISVAESAITLLPFMVYPPLAVLLLIQAIRDLT